MDIKNRNSKAEMIYTKRSQINGDNEGRQVLQHRKTLVKPELKL